MIIARIENNFSGSSVMRLKEENPVLAGLVDSYNLRGFSFREYLNLMASTHFPSYSLSDIITNHRAIAQEICAQVNPLDYFPGYCIMDIIRSFG